jgi:hypothetical protein
MPDDAKEIKKRMEALQKKLDETKREAEELQKLVQMQKQMDQQKEMMTIIANIIKSQGEAQKQIIKNMR